MTLSRKIHRVLGTLVAIQILLWISGGVVMSVIPIEKVRGNHLLEPRTDLPVPQQALPSSQKWQSLAWQQSAQGWLIKAIDWQGNTSFLEQNGHQASTINEQQISNVALARNAKDEQISDIALLHQVPFEVRHLQGPVYRVSFDDWINTSFYLHPVTGDVLSVRSDLWRLYDLFWMLHIMDYQEREDFNNPLLIVGALAALLFTMSGLILVYVSVLRPKYRKLMYKSGRNRRTI